MHSHDGPHSGHADAAGPAPHDTAALPNDPERAGGFAGMAGPEYLKGHGTENDFVVLVDPDGELDLTAARVRGLCDRRRGLGADGVLRVVRTEALNEPVPVGVEAGAWPTWFMDYRNADGSAAEMCGNGIRVFARYLVEAGLVGAGAVPVGTRAGTRTVTAHPDGRVSVDMGPAAVLGKSSLALDGREFGGVAVSLGNPHLACIVPEGLRALDLSRQPPYDHELFPHGVNLEFVRIDGPDSLSMRVYERGVGETRSCGTGTVAATVAALHACGSESGRRLVRIPGGAVEVEVTPETTTLTGPAVLLARGRLDVRWWERMQEDDYNDHVTPCEELKTPGATCDSGW